MDALIGFTGFVGATLLKQKTFQALYRSTNIADICGQSFDTVVCAGAPGQKWLANKQPENDRACIDLLIEKIKTVKCKQFILISTVDVFKNPENIDEHSPVDEEQLQPYGLHRRELEKFVAAHFDQSLIVRLPGLVGPGLRKNIIFDFHHNNNIGNIDCRGTFQFYPMINLWYDIEIALKNKIELLHLTAEPLSVAEIAKAGFGMDCTTQLSGKPANYNMQSRYARLFSEKNGNYQYSKRETLMAVRAYAQSENKKG
ncbi:NAD-dependent epimerase/dehydratase family protein [Erwinia psidii]|uniref:NAD(P)-dependent oxidoreductase n=1 Tax=Erwinia psidii TaxID=69224 RepID=A0A3N6V3S6_9GAMM|nr:NAD-dependent epimerase/dehydratase family protein [Erwinia psidii]MCX8956421.1 NAD(P)-dependent oxidoreductase [Erwinia psidii]MCX8962267.1 NAD(P)-dependent oxidoreductase [Erwinia psidii]MCX8965812.1 NAD(P)-dependent oxidoreductase [Erwinia psidii]RQM39755.1 NAD(P)-dependent oxidoreductase [Erwinia psidii]